MSPKIGSANAESPASASPKAESAQTSAGTTVAAKSSASRPEPDRSAEPDATAEPIQLSAADLDRLHTLVTQFAATPILAVLLAEWRGPAADMVIRYRPRPNIPAKGRPQPVPGRHRDPMRGDRPA